MSVGINDRSNDNSYLLTDGNLSWFGCHQLALFLYSIKSLIQENIIELEIWNRIKISREIKLNVWNTHTKPPEITSWHFLYLS